jgi:hypothetical protein
MSSLINNKELMESVNQSSVTVTSGFELQARDYEILRFILEQKFASLEAIYFRFFDVRKVETDPLPKNLWTTRQRLSKLRASALLKTEKVLSSGKAHFLLTPFGHKVLTHHVSTLITIKPTKEIDFSLYEHDSRITMIRALTEARKKCTRWYSEKWLKASPIYIDNKYKYIFSKDIRPDAVFINSKGERIALELEMSRKGRRRLEEKINLYDDLLESRRRYGDESGGQEEYKVLDKVWFVTTKPAVHRHLQRAVENSSVEKMSYRIDLYEAVVPEVCRV